MNLASRIVLSALAVLFMGTASTPFTSPANAQGPSVFPDEDAISQFVRRIFQDSRGHLWFGTNGDGVARYDGESLQYFSINEGFGGVAVRGIVEDQGGNVWFGTEGGLTRFDGVKTFTNYTEADGLPGNDVWALTIDRRGTIWVGTTMGACRFDGETFTKFSLPESEPDPLRGVTSAWIVHCILEDSRDRMWFATNSGVWIHDGKALTNLSEKDGLCNNAVNCILEARDGSFWFATHHNGVCRWDGETFTHFTEPEHGVGGIEAWSLYQDSQGGIWFPMENAGLYRYDGTSFTEFSEPHGLKALAIQDTFEDREGRLWAGGYTGLYRLEGDRFVQVGITGPWE